MVNKNFHMLFFIKIFDSFKNQLFLNFIEIIYKVVRNLFGFSSNPNNLRTAM